MYINTLKIQVCVLIWTIKTIWIDSITFVRLTIIYTHNHTHTESLFTEWKCPPLGFSLTLSTWMKNQNVLDVYTQTIVNRCHFHLYIVIWFTKGGGVLKEGIRPASSCLVRASLRWGGRFHHWSSCVCVCINITAENDTQYSTRDSVNTPRQH